MLCCSRHFCVDRLVEFSQVSCYVLVSEIHVSEIDPLNSTHGWRTSSYGCLATVYMVAAADGYLRWHSCVWQLSRLVHCQLSFRDLADYC